MDRLILGRTLGDPMFNRLSKFIRHRRRLPTAIAEETHYLQRAHGERALDVALEKLQRPELTTWGRLLYSGVAKQLRSGQARQDSAPASVAPGMAHPQADPRVGSRSWRPF